MASRVVMKAGVVLLALLLIASTRQRDVVASPSTGMLKVTVLDTIGRIVPNIPITIEGNGAKCTFSSEDYGSHEFELPAGLYQITSEKGFGYYFPVKRAPFRIVAGTTTLINVTPAPRILVIGAVLGEKDHVELAPKPKYQSLAIPNTATPELSLLVQYDHSRNRVNATEYTADKRPFSGVIVSYDVLTVCADRVTIAKGSLRVLAEGNVIVEDGQQRVHAERKVLEFRNGIPVMLD